MPRLKKSLENKVRAANLWRGQEQSLELSRGLKIRIKVTADGTTHLCLQRKDKRPSDVEWTTVLAAWPVELPEHIQPVGRQQGYTYAIVAAWKHDRPMFGNTP